MKALAYSGSRDVRVKNVTDAKIQRPTDVLLRITSSNICGSDLHMYEGRTDMEEGKVLGHENLGQMVEVGEAVDRIKVGDWVCLPFNVACGFCKNCEAGLTGACLTTNPGTAGAAFGFAGMGLYSGGQAEYLRVPYADFNCLKLPDDAQEKGNDYVMLSDIFPTGWHATELAGVKPGESVVIYDAVRCFKGMPCAHHKNRGRKTPGTKRDRFSPQDRTKLENRVGATGVPVEVSACLQIGGKQ